MEGGDKTEVTRDVHEPFKVMKHAGDDWTHHFAVPGPACFERFCRWQNVDDGKIILRMPAVAAADISGLTLYEENHLPMLEHEDSNLLGPVMDMDVDHGRILWVALCPTRDAGLGSHQLLAFEKYR